MLFIISYILYVLEESIPVKTPIPKDSSLPIKTSTPKDSRISIKTPVPRDSTSSGFSYSSIVKVPPKLETNEETKVVEEVTQDQTNEDEEDTNEGSETKKIKKKDPIVFDLFAALKVTFLNYKV